MLRSKSKRRKTRVGKTGTVRLGKKDLASTRNEVYFRANGHCEMREILIEELAARTDMDLRHRLAAIDLIQLKCWGWVSEANGHDAHLRTKRNHGDEISNRVWSCPPCHIADHNAFGKPVPAKPEVSA